MEGRTTSISIYWIEMNLVLSRNYFLRVNNVIEFEYMRKLNQKKIRWIVKEVEKGE